MIKNKLDKVFGAGGSSTGTFMFVGGLAIIYFSLIGIFIALLGAFIGFTSTYTLVDSEKKRVKPITNLFGFLPYGKWIEIEHGMYFKIKKSRKGTMTSTRGHSRAFISKDLRIILLNKSNIPIATIKKFEELEFAEKELEKLNNQFNLHNMN